MKNSGKTDRKHRLICAENQENLATARVYSGKHREKDKNSKNIKTDLLDFFAKS